MPIDPLLYTYPFDPTGTASTNKIENETQIITPVNYKDFQFFIPDAAPFFKEGFVLTFRDTNGNTVPLSEGIDYYFAHHFIAASKACAKQLYGSIALINRALSGVVTLSYQTVGGMWTYDRNYLNELITNIQSNPRVSTWDAIVELPATFPVIDHEYDLVDMVGMSEVYAKLSEIAVAIATSAPTTPADLGAYSIAEVDVLIDELYTAIDNLTLSPASLGLKFTYQAQPPVSGGTGMYTGIYQVRTNSLIDPQLLVSGGEAIGANNKSNTFMVNFVTNEGSALATPQLNVLSLTGNPTDITFGYTTEDINGFDYYVIYMVSANGRAAITVMDISNSPGTFPDDVVVEAV